MVQFDWLKLSDCINYYENSFILNSVYEKLNLQFSICNLFILYDCGWHIVVNNYSNSSLIHEVENVEEWNKKHIFFAAKIQLFEKDKSVHLSLHRK